MVRPQERKNWAEKQNITRRGFVLLFVGSLIDKLSTASMPKI